MAVGEVGGGGEGAGRDDDGRRSRWTSRDVVMSVSGVTRYPDKHDESLYSILPAECVPMFESSLHECQSLEFLTVLLVHHLPFAAVLQMASPITPHRIHALHI